MEGKVSIIVPCYNHAQFLDESLNSVLEQIYQNWECVIINDGSTDNTEEVAKKWCKRDKRFRYVAQQNAGVSSARNMGISVAKGKYILPLDADDLIAAPYLKLAVEIFEKNNSLKLVYCNARKFGQIEEVWNRRSFSLQNLALANMIFSSAVYRKSDWQRVGGYDESLIYGYEDYEFWINLLKGGGEVYEIPHTYFYYRIQNVSRNTIIKEWQFAEIYKYLSKKHSDFFVDQLGSFHDLIREITLLKKENRELKRKRPLKNKILNFIKSRLNGISKF